MHYAVAIAFWERQRLERYFTDIYLPFECKFLAGVAGETVRRLFGRNDRRLQGAPISSFWAFGLSYWWQLRKDSDRSRVYYEYGRRFQEEVTRHFPPETECVYSMNQCSDLTFRQCGSDGTVKVLEQCIVPLGVERRMVAAAEGRADCVVSEWDQRLMEREEREWKSADVIVCPSRFVEQSLPEEVRQKAVVVPYGYGGEETNVGSRNPGRPLRVLLLGAVGYRKGARVAGEVARRLRGRAEFHWYGPMTMEWGECEKVLKPITPHPPVSHGEIPDLMRRHDVLFLPSVCEGSATVLYEAMNHGLPIVTSVGSGAPFADGECGRVLASNDTAAFVDALARLADDRAEYGRAVDMAVSRRREFTASAYRARLCGTVKRVFSERSGRK